MTSSPFLLNGTMKVHLEKYLPLPDQTEFIKQLILNLYVEDLSNSFNTVDESSKFYEISKLCLNDANFYYINGQQIIMIFVI